MPYKQLKLWFDKELAEFWLQKSVANCLNDILKDNPDIAKAIITNWTVNPTSERKWIVNHALRNLKKKNDTWALGIISSF